MSEINRRDFMKGAAATAALTAMPMPFFAEEFTDKNPYKISLAQWSIRSLRKKVSALDFPVFTKKTFGITGIEYVNTFFFKQAKDKKFLTDLKKRCDDNGVRSVLIMCDREGHLGDPNAAKRTKAIENHYKWIEAAKFLGCHSIRVNAHSKGSREEQMKLVVDGLSRLSTFGAKHNINVIVENHGGLSSDGGWLSETIKKVDMKNCGTLPDFGNFGKYDRYKGTKELMPFAKGVSAKSVSFDDKGNEKSSDYFKLMKIVKESGFKGYVGIEYGGGGDCVAQIKKTKVLLEKTFKAMGVNQ